MVLLDFMEDKLNDFIHVVMLMLAPTLSMLVAYTANRQIGIWRLSNLTHTKFVYLAVSTPSSFFKVALSVCMPGRPLPFLDLNLIKLGFFFGWPTAVVKVSYSPTYGLLCP